MLIAFDGDAPIAIWIPFAPGVMPPVEALLRLADVGEDVSPFAQPETDNILAIVKTSVILVSFETNGYFRLAVG